MTNSPRACLFNLKSLCFGGGQSVASAWRPFISGVLGLKAAAVSVHGPELSGLCRSANKTTPLLLFNVPFFPLFIVAYLF